MNNLSQKTIGRIQIILSGFCFGFLGIFGKIAFTKGFTAGELLSLRYLFGASFLFLYFIIKDFRQLKLNFKTVLLQIGLGIFGYALFSSFYFMALQGVSASLTVLLLYTYPILVLIINWIFLGYKMNFKSILAVVLVSIGLIALVGGEWQVSNARYILFGLLASLFYSLYIVISEKVNKNVSSLVSSFYVQLGAGLVLFALNFQNLQRPSELIQNNFIFISSMSIICSLAAMTLFLAGLRKINSYEVSILSTSEPLFGILFAITILHEKLLAIQVVGGLLILAAIFILTKSSNQHKS